MWEKPEEANMADMKPRQSLEMRLEKPAGLRFYSKCSGK
jgi:hypothetical protein